MNLPFDSYERRARLAPSLLAVAPLLLPFAAFGWRQTVVASALGAAGALALVNSARARGKRLEPGLWDLWGGPPAACLLLHDSRLNPHLRASARDSLARLTGQSLPTTEDEGADRAGALARVDAALTVAMEALRDRHESRLVASENAAYGFHRNALGLRGIGLALSVAGVVVCVLMVGAKLLWDTGPGVTPMAFFAAADLCLAWYWAVEVTREHVRAAADRYANALVRELAALTASPPTVP